MSDIRDEVIEVVRGKISKELFFADSGNQALPVSFLDGYRYSEHEIEERMAVGDGKVRIVAKRRT